MRRGSYENVVHAAWGDGSTNNRVGGNLRVSDAVTVTGGAQSGSFINCPGVSPPFAVQVRGVACRTAISLFNLARTKGGAQGTHLGSLQLPGYACMYEQSQIGGATQTCTQAGTGAVIRILESPQVRRVIWEPPTRGEPRRFPSVQLIAGALQLPDPPGGGDQYMARSPEARARYSLGRCRRRTSRWCARSTMPGNTESLRLSLGLLHPDNRMDQSRGRL